MSFLPISEQNLQAPQGQTTPQPGMTGAPPQAGGSAGSGTAGGAKGTATGTPTQFGSSASKLGDYLSANAPQIQGQADKVVSGLNQQYGQVSGDITNAANQFGQQVQGGYAAPNQNIVNQAIANPTQFAANPENVKGFQAQYNDQYTGPQNYESSTPYGQIQGEVNQAVQQAGLLGTQAGLGSYLKQGGGPNQTQASNTLDTLLLQGNPQAQQQIQQAAGQFKGLTGQFGNSVNTANQSVQAAQKAAQDAQTYAQGQFNPYVQNFATQLNTGAQNAEAQRTAYNQKLQEYLAQTAPLEQQANIFGGASGIEWGKVHNPYSTQNQITNPITTAQYATPEQYQQAAALQQLAGQNLNIPLDQTQIGQAGTAPSVPTLSNLGASGLAQEYANNLWEAEGPNHQAWGLPGNVSTDQYNQFLQYLQSVNPNTVTNTPANFYGTQNISPLQVQYNPIEV